jgi:hypothetical protein
MAEYEYMSGELENVTPTYIPSKRELDAAWVVAYGFETKAKTFVDDEGQPLVQMPDTGKWADIRSGETKLTAMVRVLVNRNKPLGHLNWGGLA